MSELNAYQLCNYCPECGTKLEIIRTPVDDIKQCKNHPLSLYPAENAQGVRVMAYDPNRATQLRKRV